MACAKDAASNQPPCARSLHVAAVWQDKVYVFGGYDGASRVNDFHECVVVTARVGSCYRAQTCKTTPSKSDQPSTTVVLSIHLHVPFTTAVKRGQVLLQAAELAVGSGDGHAAPATGPACGGGLRGRLLRLWRLRR